MPGRPYRLRGPKTRMEHLQAFYQRTGQSSSQMAGGVWLVETRLSVFSTPGSIPLRPTKSEIVNLLQRTGRIAAIFGSGFETGKEVNSFVVRDRSYGMQSLQRQFRQQVKIALQHCHCRPVEWHEMARLALPVNQSTMARRGVHAPRYTDPMRWAAYCEAASLLPGCEAIGCFVGGELAAYMITWLHAGVCYGLYMLWTESLRAAHPTHALYYETVRDRMSRPEVEAMCVGRQTVPAMTSVDRFKRHAGFMPEPCHVGVILRPGVSSIMTHPWSVRALRSIRQRAGHRWPKLHHAEVFEVAAETHLS